MTSERVWLVALTLLWLVAEALKTPRNIVERDWTHLITAGSAAVLFFSWLLLSRNTP